MPGGSTTDQTKTENSVTSPWAPAQPALMGILNKAGGIDTGANPQQLEAIRLMQGNATSAPNFGGQAGGVANTLLSGGQDYGGILNSGYDTLRGQLQPYASGSMVGKNEALQGQLDTVANDTKNSIESQFAAAGRPAGTNAAVAQAVARGTAQGQAPIIANQYNQDVQNQLGAASGLYSGAGSTAGGLSSLQQQRFGNMGAGLGAAGAVPGILNQNAASLLSAGNMQQALPFQGLGLLSSIVNPIAGMGGQSSGTSTGTTTQQTSPTSNILGGLIGGAGLLGGTGAFGSAGWMAPLLMSDERTKEDIAPVGILNDGSNVYSFKYRGDPARRTHIGLMAQEVERQTPEAVAEVGGVKFVDYDRATAPARAIGILNQMAA